MHARTVIGRGKPGYGNVVAMGFDGGPVDRASGNFPAVVSDRLVDAPATVIQARDVDVPDFLR